MNYGLYEVTQGHTFRGHASGERFDARLDRNAERRAVKRGVLRYLGPSQPELEPGSFTFPQGWLNQSTSTPTGKE